MTLTWLVFIVLALATVGFVMGRSRAMASAGGDIRGLHSLPKYYGWNVALTVITPAFGVMILWLLVQPLFVEKIARDQLQIADDAAAGLVMSDVRRISDGLSLLVDRGILSAAQATDLSTDQTDIRVLFHNSIPPVA